MFTIDTICPFCGKTTTIKIRRVADYHAWENGALAQNAFPYLSANEREMLISGICPTCWDNMFPPEEEGEE